MKYKGGRSSSGSGSRTISCSFILIYFFACVLPFIFGFPEQGKWSYVLNQTETYFGVYKSLFNNSKIFLKVKCHSDEDTNVKIDWIVRETPCWDEYSLIDLFPIEERKEIWKSYFNDPSTNSLTIQATYDRVFSIAPNDTFIHRCDNTIVLDEYALKYESMEMDKANDGKTDFGSKFKRATSYRLETTTSKHPVFTIPVDGIFLFIVKMQSIGNIPFSAELNIEMKSEHGYLSASDFPLLPFYGGSCIIYVVFGSAWLILSACQWRDLLRIQFWIGAVIFLGMLEMSVFYAEYQSINSTGISVPGAIFTAEVVSCAKRTISRMLIIIVSAGFGIVRPRLGSTLHRVIVVGFLYFVLATTESALRILHPVNGPSNKALMAGIPLSILDAGICWWIFHSLLTTTRTLRLRRNLVKLGLYRQFTNTLVFAVISSIAFMIWSIKYLKTAQCLREWKSIWIDEAFWHVLFDIILLVIMILFRPTNNNQRFSISPLMDDADDEDTDEEELVVNESFGNMKLRPKKGGYEKVGKNRYKDIDDELKWVQENIPADIGEGDLPALDSEEELISTKFELSKMQ